MRIETLFLSITLVLCLIIPLLYFFLKEKVIRKKLLNLIFYIIAGLLFTDVLLMIIYQLQSNFMFQYVYSHTSIEMSLIYKISALWAGQEGSFLLWSFILAIMGLFIMRIKTEHTDKILALYAIICSIIVLLTLRSNPFKLTNSTPSVGLGLNEALQNPWMVIHPPLVFISYSAMAVLLSLSVARDRSEQFKANMATITRQWVRVSFLFLSMGILTGSIWAYTALGWGGYWAWDPIENAALVPWLILCGYLHKKNSPSRLDCIIPFTLAGFGTFLTRSGILTNKSVHAYAGGNDSLLTFCIFSILILFVTVMIFINLKIKRKEQKNNQVKIFALKEPFRTISDRNLSICNFYFYRHHISTSVQHCNSN